MALASNGVAAKFQFRLAVIDEAADEQIEPAIIVVVEPDGAGSPSRCGDACFCCDIGKRTIPVVVIKDAVWILRKVDVRKAIAIVVADGNSHAIGIARYTGFLRDIGERAIAIIVVQRITQRLRRLIEIARSAVHQIDIHPAVVVVVEKGAAGAHGFRKMRQRRTSIDMRPADTARGRWNLFKCG